MAVDQSDAARLANQINYGNPAFSFFGYSGIGYGYFAWPGSIYLNSSSFSYPLWRVTNAEAKVKVGLYDSDGMTNTPLGTSHSNLQSHFNAVPIPNKTLCPKITGFAPFVDIFSSGSDQNCSIWNYDTDEAWEFWRLDNTGPADMQAAMGCTWTARYGGYVPSVATFNTVFPNGWGARATGLGAMGGMLLLQDVRDVWRGGTINHALCMAVPFSSASSFVGPATRTDGPGQNSITNVPGSPATPIPNPAYGFDAVKLGERFRFPANINLKAITHPMALALTCAIRDYGLILVDSSGAVNLFLEDPRVLGSPYHLQGAAADDPLQYVWPDGFKLLDFDEKGPLTQVPWGKLQLLDPVAS